MNSCPLRFWALCSIRPFTCRFRWTIRRLSTRFWKSWTGISRTWCGIRKGRILPLEQDFYRLPLAGDVSARSFGFQVGPVKWRFFWARLGTNLYIASKPYILEDLAAKLASAGDTENTAGDLSDLKAHAMIRIRPEHWQQVLPNYRLGWAERHRQSCLENVGRLSSVARMVQAESGRSGCGGPGGHTRSCCPAALQPAFLLPGRGQYVRDGRGSAAPTTVPLWIPNRRPCRRTTRRSTQCCADSPA